MMKIRLIVISALLFITTGCSKGPGDLEGTWKMKGFIPMTVKYTDGQEEAMGIISEVSYEYDGNDIIVSYEIGMAKGNKIRFTKIDNNTFRTELGVLSRVL